ncbi:hypothetical protein VE02_03737 [Pseudogymnoascus sp. 03VT05]|nr:hypothetical protein VE02_03737 [Pseudogymnoascus sp. 03VT05]
MAGAQPHVDWLGVGGTSATKPKIDRKRATSRSASRSRGTADYPAFDDIFDNPIFHTSATKPEGNEKGRTSRSASRSRGTASNSPFDGFERSDPPFQSITSVQPSSNGNVVDSNKFNWSYPDFQEYQNQKGILPQGNGLGVGGTSATNPRKDNERTSSRSRSQSRGDASNSLFDDLERSEPPFQGITSAPCPSSGMGQGIPGMKQTLGESNFSVQDMRTALPQSNGLGGGGSAYGPRSGTPTNISAGEVIVSAPSNQSLIFPEYTFAGNTINGQTSMPAHQVRSQVRNAPLPSRNAHYPSPFADHEQIAPHIPGPLMHHPIVQDRSEPYTTRPPGPFRAITSKNHSSTFVFGLHEPGGKKTGRGHTAMVEGGYHKGVHRG